MCHLFWICGFFAGTNDFYIFCKKSQQQQQQQQEQQQQEQQQISNF